MIRSNSTSIGPISQTPNNSWSLPIMILISIVKVSRASDIFSCTLHTTARRSHYTSGTFHYSTKQGDIRKSLDPMSNNMFILPPLRKLCRAVVCRAQAQVEVFSSTLGDIWTPIYLSTLLGLNSSFTFQFLITLQVSRPVQMWDHGGYLLGLYHVCDR